ncbi:toxin-antitoxin system HicB family antitoxin [Mycobacterium heckeshornense]|nr:toxin-antitoxin system HicB family antitoxin [Mycobacterium heckeshornense]
MSQRAPTLQQLHARLAIEAAEQNVWMNPWVARIDSLAASSIGDIAHDIAFQKHRMVSERCCCGHCDCGIARPGTTAGTPRTPVSANGGLRRSVTTSSPRAPVGVEVGIAGCQRADDGGCRQQL